MLKIGSERQQKKEEKKKRRAGERAYDLSKCGFVTHQEVRALDGGGFSLVATAKAGAGDVDCCPVVRKSYHDPKAVASVCVGGEDSDVIVVEMKSGATDKIRWGEDAGAAVDDIRRILAEKKGKD